jgi:hypothetical protein
VTPIPKFTIYLTGPENSSQSNRAKKYIHIRRKYLLILEDHAAADLAIRNIEEILRLDVKEETRYLAVFQGIPLEFAASVVTAVNSDIGKIMTCWPAHERDPGSRPEQDWMKFTLRFTHTHHSNVPQHEESCGMGTLDSKSRGRNQKRYIDSI